MNIDKFLSDGSKYIVRTGTSTNSSIDINSTSYTTIVDKSSPTILDFMALTTYDTTTVFLDIKITIDGDTISFTNLIMGFPSNLLRDRIIIGNSGLFFNNLICKESMKVEVKANIDQNLNYIYSPITFKDL